MRTIQQLKDILQNKSGAKSINKVSNFNAMVGESIIEVMKEVDLPSGKSKSLLINDVYNDFSYYKLPSDLNLEKIIGIRRIYDDSNTQENYNYGFNSNNQLLLDRKYYFDDETQRFAITSILGEQYLKIKEENITNKVIADCESVLSTYGNWGVNGSTNLRTNEVNRLSGNASISFDIAIGSATNGVVMLNQSKTTDISASKFIVFSLNLNSVDKIAGVKFSFGTDNTNYFYKTFTKDMFGMPLKEGWNTFYLELRDLAKVGSPVLTAIPYLDVDILSNDVSGTFLAEIKNILLDSIICGSSNLYEIEYYSSAVIYDPVNNVWKEIPTYDTDQLMLTNEEFDLLKNQLIAHFYPDLFNGNKNDRPNMEKIYSTFRFKYPSDAMVMTEEYSDTNKILN